MVNGQQSPCCIQRSCGAARKARRASGRAARSAFTAVAESQRQGGDCRLDLLVAYTASGAEFAAKREFIEFVADQTLGHAYAAACRIGALIAPDVEPAAAAEIARIADFLVLDGAASELAAEGAAAEGFALAAGRSLPPCGA